MMLKNQIKIIFLSLLWCQACGKGAKTGIATPQVSGTTVSKANPVDSKGKDTALGFKTSSKKKTEAGKKTSGGPTTTPTFSFPDGIVLEHGYLFLTAIKFNPKAVVTTAETSLFSDFLNLIKRNIAIEKQEASYTIPDTSFLLSKIGTDAGSETNLLQQADKSIANSAPAVIDVVKGDQSFGSLTVLDGTYLRFDAITGRGFGDGLEPRLIGYTFMISGSLPIKGVASPFLIRSQAPLDFRVNMTASPLIIASGAANSDLTFNFDPTNWFASLPIASASPNSDGVLLIDSSNRADLLAIAESNVLKSFVVSDSNGNLGDSSSAP